ncbi:ketosteroid isomerase [Burkholderiaceae bacterium 16]|nr:ketosteroid isomerase [Burkholderiaceae bacterium 16]
MTQDERAIRDVVDTWFTASKAGDLPTVLDLMTDDVIFMVPGRPPFGKKEFAAATEGMKNVKIDGTYDIQEVQVLGNWAYLRNHIRMTVTPPGGSAAIHRSGYTLTILRKDPDGHWRLTRDANLLAAEATAMPS